MLHTERVEVGEVVTYRRRSYEVLDRGTGEGLIYKANGSDALVLCDVETQRVRYVKPSQVRTLDGRKGA